MFPNFICVGPSVYRVSCVTGVFFCIEPETLPARRRFLSFSLLALSLEMPLPLGTPNSCLPGWAPQKLDLLPGSLRKSVLLNFVRKIRIPGKLAVHGKSDKSGRTMVFTVKLTWVLTSASWIPRCEL